MQLAWPDGEFLSPTIETNDGDLRFNELNLRSEYMKIRPNQKDHLVTLVFLMN